MNPHICKRTSPEEHPTKTVLTFSFNTRVWYMLENIWITIANGAIHTRTYILIEKNYSNHITIPTITCIQLRNMIIYVDVKPSWKFEYSCGRLNPVFCACRFTNPDSNILRFWRGSAMLCPFPTRTGGNRSKLFSSARSQSILPAEKTRATKPW